VLRNTGLRGIAIVNVENACASSGTALDAAAERSVFMDLYVERARDRIEMALVSVKNRRHGARNPFAQFREEVSVEAVLGSRRVAGPLTLQMCSPLSDGAAAIVLTSSSAKVRISASVLTSGRGDDATQPTAASRAAERAYELAAVGPSDLDVVELHDATAPAELELYEQLGFGDASRLIRDGVTALGGRLPVNPSGGLLSPAACAVHVLTA
jgi:acetyl-CoA acetyltransferase